jgi:hypothetical protein
MVARIRGGQTLQTPLSSFQKTGQNLNIIVFNIVSCSHSLISCDWVFFGLLYSFNIWQWLLLLLGFSSTSSMKLVPGEVVALYPVFHLHILNEV